MVLVGCGGVPGCGGIALRGVVFSLDMAFLKKKKNFSLAEEMVERNEMMGLPSN